jgi:hypothetical protein
VTTVSVLIGNSDDKLTQAEWTALIKRVRRAIAADVVIHGGIIHFEGFALADKQHQNACWIIELPSGDDAVIAEHALRHDLAWLAELFGQDSIAWVVGATEFIRPTPHVPHAEIDRLRDEHAVRDAVNIEFGLGFTHEMDDTIPVASHRFPMHIVGVNDGGVFIDETTPVT